MIAIFFFTDPSILADERLNRILILKHLYRLISENLKHILLYNQYFISLLVKFLSFFMFIHIFLQI